MLVLKSNENVEMWYSRLSQLANSSKPCKNSLRRVQSVRPSFHTSSRSFYKAQYNLVDGFLWQIIPYCLQDFLQLVDGIWLGLKCLVAFKHSSPDMVIKRITVWWVWQPFVIIIQVLPKKIPVKNCKSVVLQSRYTSHTTADQLVLRQLRITSSAECLKDWQWKNSTMNNKQ